MPDETNEITPHADQDGDLIAQLTLDYLDTLNGSRDELPLLDDLSSALRGRGTAGLEQHRPSCHR